MSNNIDDFFKDGLNQNEFEYSEETWNGFQELYEKEKEDDPVIIPFINKSLLIGGLVLLSLLGITFYGFNKYSINDVSTNNTTSNNIIANSPVKESTQTTTNNKAIDISETTDVTSSNTDINLNKQTTSFATTTNKYNQLNSSSNNTETSSTTLIHNNSFSNSRKNSTSIKSNLTTAIPAPIQQPVAAATTTSSPVTKLNRKEKEPISFAKIQDFKAINSLPVLATELLDNELSSGMDLRIKHKRHLKGQFFLMASLGLGNIDSQNFEIGIGKKLSLNKYLGINIGAKYKYIRAQKLERHRGFDVKYSVADQVFFANHIEADILHMAAIPVSLEVAYKRHRLNWGATYNRLFLVKGEITRNEGDIESIRTAWIVETGLNLNLFSTNVAYGFMINPSTEIFAGAEVFLTDTYNNESTISHKFNNYNLGLKFYINSLKKNQTLRFL